MKDVPYHLRSCKNVLAPKSKTTGYGIESAGFLGSRIWHALPSSIKSPKHSITSKELLGTMILDVTVDCVSCI